MWRRTLWILLGLALLAPRPAVAQDSIVALDFEGAPDATAVGATIPGVVFSASAGAEWTYGDVRTGRYNAPYPQDCPDFGAACAYAVAGSGFVWMGEAAGVGRIDFVGATASFFGAGFSTADTLSVAAYDAHGAALDVQTVAPNLRTGRLDRVALRANGAGPIAYVLISGGQNRWLMDDLATDASVTAPPPLPTPASRAAQPAAVTVVQRAAPNLAVARGGLLTLTIAAVNRGHGAARDLLISLPLDPAVLSVVDARFSRAGAWVSALTADRVELRTGPLAAQGDGVTITLRLRVRADAPPGASAGGRLSFRWQDAAGGGSGRSNALSAMVGERDEHVAALPLHVEPAGDGRLRYAAVALAPFEPVGVWYNAPDGAAVAVTSLRADASGLVDATFAVAGLPAGSYTLVVAGEWSKITSVGAFTVAASAGG